MKLLGIGLLSIVSSMVFITMVLPVAASRILGLGIEVPRSWARSGNLRLILLYPWFCLFVSILLLAVFGWGHLEIGKRVNQCGFSPTLPSPSMSNWIWQENRDTESEVHDPRE